MSFAKSKTKRFNEIASCAPPVGSYDPLQPEKVPCPVLSSGDARFKEPKADCSNGLMYNTKISSSLSNLSMVPGDGFMHSTPNKYAAAYCSSESLADLGKNNDAVASRIPRKTAGMASIIPPAEFAKIKELEKQVKLLVQERSELLKRVEAKDDDLTKIKSRLQNTQQEHTSLVAATAALERDLADLRKANETLKSKNDVNESGLRRSNEEKHRLELEHSSLQKDLSLLKNELSRITAEKKALCDEVKKLESSKCSAEEQLNLREQQCVDLEENVRKLKDELLSANNQLHTERLAFELDKAAHSRNVSEMQNELDEVKIVKADSVEKCTKLEADVVSLTNELQMLNRKIQDDYVVFEAEKQLQINSISCLQDELQNRLAELKNLSSEKLEMGQKCLNLEDTVEKLTTEIECMNERLSQERLSFEAEKLSQLDMILKLEDELKVMRVALEKVERDKTVVGEKCAVLEGVVSSLTEEVESVRIKFQEERVALTTENEAKQCMVMQLENKLQSMQEKLESVAFVKNEIEGKCAELENQVQNLTDDLKIISNKLNQEQSIVEAEREEQKTLIMQLRAEVRDKQALLEKTELQKAENEEKCANLESTVKKLGDDLECVNSQLIMEKLAFEGEKESNQNAFVRLQAELQITQLELAKVEFAKSEVEVELSYIKQDLTQAKSTITQLEDNLKRSEATVMESLKLKTESDALLAEATLKCSDLLAELDQLKLESKTTSLEKTKLEIALNSSSEEISKLTAALNEADTAKNDAQSKLSELQRQITDLTKMVEASRYEVCTVTCLKEELETKLASVTNDFDSLYHDRELKLCTLKETQALLDVKSVETESLNNQLVLLKGEAELLQKEISCVNSALDEATHLATERLAKIASLESVKCELESTLKVRSHEVTVVMGQLADSENSRKKLESKCHMIELDAEKMMREQQSQLDEARHLAEVMKRQFQVKESELEEQHRKKMKELRTELHEALQHSDSMCQLHQQQLAELEDVNRKAVHNLQSRLNEAMHREDLMGKRFQQKEVELEEKSRKVIDSLKIQLDESRKNAEVMLQEYSYREAEMQAENLAHVQELKARLAASVEQIAQLNHLHKKQVSDLKENAHRTAKELQSQVDEARHHADEMRKQHQKKVDELEENYSKMVTDLQLRLDEALHQANVKHQEYLKTETSLKEEYGRVIEGLQSRLDEASQQIILLQTQYNEKQIELEQNARIAAEDLQSRLNKAVLDAEMKYKEFEKKDIELQMIKSVTVKELESRLQSALQEADLIRLQHQAKQSELDHTRLSLEELQARVKDQQRKAELKEREFLEREDKLEKNSKKLISELQMQIDAALQKANESSQKEEAIRKSEKLLQVQLDEARRNIESMHNIHQKQQAALEEKTRKAVAESQARLEEVIRQADSARQQQQKKEIALEENFKVSLEACKKQLECRCREVLDLNNALKEKQKSIDTLTDKYMLVQTDLECAQQKLNEKHHQLDVDLDQLISDCRRWQAMYEDLWSTVAPFEEQLRAFEKEKQLLLGKSKNAQQELEVLSHNYAKLLGHQNQKQKIHHILKLKEENLALKQELQSFRDQQVKDKRLIRQQSEKIEAMEGKRRFDPAKAFNHTLKENDASVCSASFMAPLRESIIGNQTKRTS